VSEHLAPARAATVVIGLQIALFVTLGLPDGALGVAWASMRGSFDRSLGDLGVVLALNTVGYLAGSTSAATAARRIGTPRTMTASTAVAAAAMALWVATGSWMVLLVAALVLGVSRGAIDAGMNAYVALHGGVRRLGVLHGSYGIGTSLGPLLVLASLATGTWRPAWIAIGALDLVIAVLGWRWRHLWPPDITVAPPSATEDAGPRRSALVVPVTMLCFAVLVGAEFSTGTWSYTLLTDGRGMDDTPAGLWVASYWAGLTAARFALGAVGDRFGRVALLHGSCALALAGVLLLWWDPAGLGVLGLPIAGVGFGVVFPTLVALMPDRLGAHRSSAVIGWSVAAASLGGTAVAALAGALADRYGAAVLAPTLVIVTALLGALHLALVGLAPVSSEGDRRRAVAPC
jgi:fucose permease